MRNMTIVIRAPETLNHTSLFSEDCVKSRLQELTAWFIEGFALDEMTKIVDKAKRKFEPVPQYDFSQQQLTEKFGETARKQAEAMLEQERKAFVESRMENIKDKLSLVIRQLRSMVFVVDEEGKVSKLKIVIEKVVEPSDRGGVHDIQYVGERDFLRFEQIGRVRSQLGEFNEYVPYFSEEVQALWNQALELGNLETVRKEKE